MKGKKRAVGYVCDIPVSDSGLVISKEDQRLRILKYAEKENLELVCIYEDDCWGEDCMSRAGVKSLCNCKEQFDVVLVERVWALSRKMKELEAFLSKLDERKVPLIATSVLWDCVSQQVRHRYSEKLGDKMHALARAKADAKHRQKAA